MINKITNRKTPILWGVVILGLLMGANAGWAAQNPQGEKVYNAVCIGCHGIGVLGAPKHLDLSAWKVRLEKGVDTLVQNALNGFGKMPPKGGRPDLEAKDIRAAIGFMAGEELIGGASKLKLPIALAVNASLTQPKGAKISKGNSKNGSEAQIKKGRTIVNRVCKGCHAIGVLGAPKIGSKKDWDPRLVKGEKALVQNAKKGIGNMPPKGGNSDLVESDLLAAIRYMINPPASPKPKVAAKKQDQPTQAAIQAPKPSSPLGMGANRFNRLLRLKSERNPPPLKDGIHDPKNEIAEFLQHPQKAFKGFAKSSDGNYIDWVKTLEKGIIAPRWDLEDPAKKPIIMDLNIVREVKGSMPDVVYPHKQHLQWLDCSNCHPAIFIPKKGANQISMAEILLGRKCGICHGKVAFPISECRRCHSKKKTGLKE